MLHNVMQDETQICLAVIYEELRNMKKNKIMPCFIGPADCNHCNCNHVAFSESGKRQSFYGTGLETTCAYSCRAYHLLAL